MLKKGLPKPGDIVICTVKRITQFAAWVELNEYEDVDGLIHISEVAGKWVRDIREFVKQGKMYVTKVMSVDRKRKLVRLSLRRVSKFEKKEKLREYRMEKRFSSILKQVAKKLKKEDELPSIIEKIFEKYKSLREFFEELREGKIKVALGEKWIKEIKDVIEKSIKEKVFTLKAKLIIKSYEPNGIERIRNILIELEKLSNGKVKYISAPFYLLSIQTKNPKKDKKNLVNLLNSFSKKFGMEYEME